MGVEQWLDTANRVLDGRTPQQLLAEGRTDMVHAAATAFVDGTYL